MSNDLKTPARTGQKRSRTDGEGRLSSIGRGVVHVLLWTLLMVLAVVVLYPLLWMVFSSFKTTNEIFTNPWSLPSRISGDSYASAFDRGVLDLFKNSLFVTVLSVAGATVFSAWAAYPLSRLKIPFSSGFLYFILGGLMLAPTVALVPLFRLLHTVGLDDNLWGLILVYTAFKIPFTTFLVRSYMLSIPQELDEAATIDGAGTWRIFWRIIFPLCKPILVTAALLQALFSWNEFAFALVLISDERKMTLPVGLARLVGQFVTDYPALFASLTVATVPVILLFLVGQRSFVRGLTAGATK